MGLGFQVQSYGDLSGAPCRGKFNGISERNNIGTRSQPGIIEGFLGNLHRFTENPGSRGVYFQFKNLFKTRKQGYLCLKYSISSLF